MENINFFYKKNNKNLILFLHGFTGGNDTWHYPRKEEFSFPNLLKNEEAITSHFDIAVMNYYSKFMNFGRSKTLFNSILRVLKSPSNISYRNVGISELSELMFSNIHYQCGEYENIVVIAHSMGGLVAKAYILDQLKETEDCKIKLFLSLAVPHNGVDWATIGRKLYGKNPQLVDLAGSSDFLAKIKQEWIDQATGLPKVVYFHGHHDQVVQRNDAIGLQTEARVKAAIDADHFTICKPKDKNDLIFKAVREEILKFREEGGFDRKKRSVEPIKEDKKKSVAQKLESFLYNEMGIVEITHQYIDSYGFPTKELCQGYYKGDPVSWNLVKQGFTARRKLTGEVLNYLEKETSQVAIITGAGGEGKSTVLMQIGLSLLENDYKVIHLDGTIKIPDSIFQDNQKPMALIIDDASKLENLSDVIRYSFNLKYPIKIVAAARENEWLHSKAFKSLDGPRRRLSQTFVSAPIDEGEAKEIAKLLIETETTDDSRSIAELTESLLKDSNGFLLAAMLTTTFGKSLEQILYDVIENIHKLDDSNNVIEVLAIIVVIEKANIKSRKQLYCNERLLNKASEIKAGAYKNLLVGEIQAKGGTICTRHERITEVIYSILFLQSNHFDTDEEDIIRKILYAAGILLQIRYSVNENNLLTEIPKLYASMPHCSFVSELFQVASEANPRNVHIWSYWAEYEYKNTNIGTISKKGTTRDIYYEGSKNVPNHFLLWDKWLKLEIKQKNLGQVNVEGSARWIAKMGTDNNPNQHSLWLTWLELEREAGNIGTMNTEGSARWIAKMGTDITPNYHAIWFAWLELEREVGNIGTVETEGSARWIAKMGTDNNPNYYAIQFAWIELEREAGNIGTVETEGSARWIAKMGTDNNLNSTEIWFAWIELEREAGNIGTMETEGSARWIAKMGTDNNPNHHILWTAWLELEREAGNIGTVETEGSARWIAKTGIDNNLNSVEIWVAWLELEREAGNIGTVETEGSARWIAKTGIDNNLNSPVIWAAWLELEREAGNIGTVETEGSARWIAKMGTDDKPNHYLLWFAWLELEREAGNIGTVETEGSARWIAKMGTDNNPSHHVLWIAWIALEREAGNIGTVETEGSARWVAKMGTDDNKNPHSSIWIVWANLEYAIGNIGTVETEGSARWIYKQAEEAKGLLPVAVNWFNMERDLGNIGNINAKYTAIWILENSLQPYKRNVNNIWGRFINREIDLDNLGDINEPYSALWFYRRCKDENLEFLKTLKGKEITNRIKSLCGEDNNVRDLLL